MSNIFMGILTVLGVWAVWDSFFVVRQKTSSLIERLGKFHSVRDAGLNFKIPFFDQVVGTLSLRIQQLDVDIETKTKDDVFVICQVSVQYVVLPERVREAFYQLEDPERQVRSFVFDTVRSEIPNMTVDEVFSNKDALAQSIQASLSDAMENFGFQIINSLVTDIQPDHLVKEAMNKINATEREKAAASNEADAYKIKLVKKAEAEAESKRLHGKGLADQRMEIATGIRASINTIKEAGVSEDEVMTLLLVTQHYDALQDVAENSNSNTVMMNYSPAGVGDIASQIREAVLSVRDPQAITGEGRKARGSDVDLS